MSWEEEIEMEEEKEKEEEKEEHLVTTLGCTGSDSNRESHASCLIEAVVLL